MKTWTMISAALSAVALTLTLAGCGPKPAQPADVQAAPSTAAPAASAHFDPCSVLTTDEVTAVTTDKVSKTNAIGPDCHYQTVNDEDGTVVTIHRKHGAEEMQDVRNAYKMLGGIGNVVSAQGSVGKDVKASITTPVDSGAPAIGDEALWGPKDVLAVRKGELFVQITPPVVHAPARMIRDSEKRVIAQKLAEAVLAKLAP